MITFFLLFCSDLKKKNGYQPTGQKFGVKNIFIFTQTETKVFTLHFCVYKLRYVLYCFQEFKACFRNLYYNSKSFLDKPIHTSPPKKTQLPYHKLWILPLWTEKILPPSLSTVNRYSK